MKNFLAILLVCNGKFEFSNYRTRSILKLRIFLTVLSTSLAQSNCVCAYWSTYSAGISPVCASDGRTYRNSQLVAYMNTCFGTSEYAKPSLCITFHWKILNFPDLRIVSNGVCGATSVAITSAPIPTIDVRNGVCDTKYFSVFHFLIKNTVKVTFLILFSDSVYVCGVMSIYMHFVNLSGLINK